MRRVFGCIVTSAALVLSAGAAQNPPQTPPVFRAGVEIFHLDVSVLDKNRQPVRGLTAADFTLLEDGRPQKIVATSFVDIPDPEPPPSAWMRDVTPDVTTNQVKDRRLFVIVMDDATIPASPYALNSAKRIGREVVNRLGPADLAAIVFPRDNRHAQEFTNDHAKLLAAVEHYTIGFGDPPGPKAGAPKGAPPTDLYFKQSSIDAVADAARFLIEIPERRKALVYITFGIGIPIEELAPPALTGIGASASQMGSREAVLLLQKRLINIFSQAERANVNVYPFDICGLRPPKVGVPPDPCGYDQAIHDFLLGVAENTGGHATLNTNDFTPGIAQMFRENSSYYILGYESTNQKGEGHFRRLEVKVNRPDVDVRSRSIYYAEKTPPLKPGTAPASPLAKSVAGLMPKADLPLRATAAPFAMPGRLDQAAVAIVLKVDQVVAAPSSGLAPSRLKNLNVLVSAFDPEGRPRGSQNGPARLTARPDRSGHLRYELLAQMSLKPGRYQLRLAAHDATPVTDGSVYVDVEIPDFAKALLSLSGVLLSGTPGLPSAPRDALAALVPILPTAVREFATTDRVAAFLRVYQGGDLKRQPVLVEVTTRIRDSQDKVAVDVPETLGTDRFGAARTAEMKFDLPLDKLAPGQYLLTIEARVSDKVTARRDVRFSVK